LFVRGDLCEEVALVVCVSEREREREREREQGYGERVVVGEF
jgi:hypothetical protein